MSAVLGQGAGITRDTARLSFGIGGTPTDALVSSARPDTLLWRQAIDEMLGWKSVSCANQFEPVDQPDEAILDTAIDYAWDQIADDRGDPAPASIVLSGSGRIAMEWNDGPFTIIIEFIAVGRASYTRFNCGRLEAEQILNRNPKSRKLELRG